MNAVQIIFAAIGSLFVDTVGRRPLLIWVNIGCGLCWIGVTAASGVQASSHSKVSSGVTVAMIYLFQCVYSFGWTPLQALYPVEVLSFEMRAKGMAFSGMFVTIGNIPIQLKSMFEADLPRYYGQPIWFPGSLSQYSMEDLCCLFDLVFRSVRHYLFVDA